MVNNIMVVFMIFLGCVILDVNNYMCLFVFILFIINEYMWVFGIRVFLYLFIMVWCFFGVVFIVDVFMCVIEKIIFKIVKVWIFD